MKKGTNFHYNLWQTVSRIQDIVRFLQKVEFNLFEILLFYFLICIIILQIYILENTFYPAASTLRKIKQEFLEKEKLNSNIDADTAASKAFFENFSEKFSNNDIVTGFIQEHYHNPFGCLLLSQIQVRILFYLILQPKKITRSIWVYVKNTLISAKNT